MMVCHRKNRMFFVRAEQAAISSCFLLSAISHTLLSWTRDERRSRRTDEIDGFLLNLLGTSQGQRHGHRATRLRLALRSTLRRRRTPVTLVSYRSRKDFDGHAA